MFKKTLFAAWGYMDFNAHMGNTAFLNKAGDVRMMFFSENGFPMQAFRKQRLGPVVMKDEIAYYKEINLLEEFTVSLSLTGLSNDGSRRDCK
ncbi:thioesterase family protein [Thalassomonas sp. RHCl1]|uniref:thioesterase family protein n=1 Tax=Thalassomonas sp. RHCl1 TaxID=2995320 RepID=UPI00248B4AC7|nr:thioesterase family protein [Thalassomonas sp. RHCl1]